MRAELRSRLPPRVRKPLRRAWDGWRKVRPAVRRAPVALVVGIVRWLAPVAAIGFTWVTLHHYEVSYTDCAVVTAYLLLCITLPGMLVWRLLRRRTDVFYLDAGCGFAVGCAIQLATYLPARWIGQPELVLVPPVVVLGLFAAVPRWWRWWRGSPAGSVAGAWIIAISVAVGVALVAAGGFRSEPLAGFGSRYIFVDIPFQLALAGELKHHVPFRTPYVWDTPLQYHWFVHAHVAATSWATGAEIEVLIRRVMPVAMLIACAIGTAGLAQSWARRRWVGPVAAAVLIGAAPVTLYGWQRYTPMTVLDLPWWASPTQAFAQVMVIPVVALMVSIVRKRRFARPGVWVLFALSCAAVMAAKATMLPLVLAGICMSLGSWLVCKRRIHLPSVLALLIVGAAMAFAQFVIFGGGSWGTSILPFEQAERMQALYGFEVQAGDGWGVWATVLVVVALVYGYALLAAGMFGFGRRLLSHPAVAALFGIAIAGQGAAMVLVQHGGSERYFVRSAAALTIPLALWGLAFRFRKFGPRTKLVVAVLVVGAPFLALWIGWQTLPKPMPAGPDGNWRATWATAGPIAAAVLLAVLIGLTIKTAGRFARRRITAVGLACALLMAMGTLPTGRVLARYQQAVALNGLDHVITRSGPYDIPWRGKEAARFLRDNSDPDELVATNGHCRIPERLGCDSRSFWLSGYTERRILLAGWGYTSEANSAADRTGAIYDPFWDQELEARNDAVFMDPNPNAAAILKDRYGVDVLFVDERFGAVDPDRMNRIAQRIYDRGEVEIWRLR